MPGQNLLDGFLDGHLVIFSKFLIPISGVFPFFTLFAAVGAQFSPPSLPSFSLLLSYMPFSVMEST